MAEQYICEGELSAIKGLIHYLNERDRGGENSVAFDVVVWDSNGEAIGTIKAAPGDAGYALHFQVMEP